MANPSRSFNIALAIATLMAIAPAANAYIDGGTGSYLLQVVIAGALGSVFVAKNWLAMAKAKIVRRSRVK